MSAPLNTTRTAPPPDGSGAMTPREAAPLSRRQWLAVGGAAALSGAAALGVGLSSAGPQTPPQRQDGTGGDARPPEVTAGPLRVVMDAAAAPIAFIDERGQPRGLAVELLRYAAQAAQVPLGAIVPMPRADALAAFLGRGADLLLDGVRTDERARHALFTRPYQALTSVLVSRLMGRHAQSLEACRGLRLALVAGHEAAPLLARRYRDIQLVEQPSHTAVLDAVSRGAADVALVASEFAQGRLQSGHHQTLAITALLPELAYELSFMLQPELLALQLRLNEAMAAVPERWWSAARERWFGGEAGRGAGGLLSWARVLDEASPWLLLAGGAAVGSSWWIVRLWREVQRRRQAEQVLAAARDAQAHAAAHRQRFISFLSHESRSLVAGIHGGLELLAQEPQHGLRQRVVDGLRANAAGLRQLLDESLDAAAIDAGAVSVKPRPVRLRCLLRPLRDEASVIAASRRLSFDVEFGAATELRVLADPVRLAQALRNLVFNALKFTDQGGVRVSAEAVRAGGDARVRIEVADSGRGLAPEEIEQLFRPFTPLAPLSDRGVPQGHAGTGLGLAISQELVRRMGGALLVASTPGQGSRFSIELPAVLEPIAEAVPALA